MTNLVDNLIAFRILYMLCTPFENSDAYKLGIVDSKGNQIKKVKDFTTSDERDAYNNLTRLVFNLKKLLAKAPGGSSQFASIVAAYWLIKESYKSKSNVTQEDFDKVLSAIENGVTLVEEEIEIEKFIVMLEDGGAIANTAGAATATDQAAIRINKKNKPISGILGMSKYIARRKSTTKVEQK